MTIFYSLLPSRHKKVPFLDRRVMRNGCDTSKRKGIYHLSSSGCPQTTHSSTEGSVIGEPELVLSTSRVAKASQPRRNHLSCTASEAATINQ
ncbi:hypothetical protein NPIL_561611 [Nephila pilipes]|uniref:Uncharacterized protein n=1 Tax=Nephila pilipes TaxID=299642 RepID=A0A8X6N0L7_NEPPI|nr:hypothetical protein NPIL_561611 [Nephila pilipes]